MNRITFLKNIDRVLGRALTVFLSPGGKSFARAPHTLKRILLIRPGGIGDAVLLLPAIKGLKQTFPEAAIDILAEKRNAGVFGLSADIHRVYLYDKGIDLFRCLGNSYDAVIDTEQWHRLSAVVAYLTKAGVRIGFDTNERSRLFTHKIPYSHDDYEGYSFIRLIEQLTGTLPEFAIDAPFASVDPESSRHFFEGSSDKGGIFVAVFPGASVAQRRWGGDKFGRVAGILSLKGYKIVIVGSEGDRGEAAKIREHAPSAIDLTGRTNLAEVAAVLNRCRLLVTADSGLMHLAFAVGTPTVSLFGPGIEKKWAPRGKRHLVINKRLDCSPCTRFGYTPECAAGVTCLSAITVEEVAAAAELILT